MFDRLLCRARVRVRVRPIWGSGQRLTQRGARGCYGRPVCKAGQAGRWRRQGDPGVDTKKAVQSRCCAVTLNVVRAGNAAARCCVL